MDQATQDATLSPREFIALAREAGECGGRSLESRVAADLVRTFYLCSAARTGSCGFPDAIDDDRVYEVKRCELWKHAMGQALAYAFDNRRIPVVVLFDCSLPMLRDAVDVCIHYGVEVFASYQNDYECRWQFVRVVA